MEELLQKPLTEFEEWNTNLNEDTEILVTIWCLTYNHEKYIRDALEGFLMQRTNFIFEVIVFDDASTDGTSEIVREYAKKYPDVIKAFIAKTNTFGKAEWSEFIRDWQRKFFRGKYIAVCEGDDYWVDRHKLQIQVDYMENHQECSLYMHNGLRLNCKEGTLQEIAPFDGPMEKDISAEEIIMQYKGNPPTGSMLYRREFIKMLDFFGEAPVGDYPLQLFCFTKGKVHYSSRNMSVYRWLSDGSYNSRLGSNKEMRFYFNYGLLLFLVQYDQYTNYKYHLWIRNKIQAYACGVIECTDLEMEIEKHYKKCKELGYYFPPDSEKYLVKLENLRKQICDMAYCSDSVKKFAKNHKRLVIMGKGGYGLKIAKQFENNNIKYDGFVVSNKVEGEDLFRGKPVWALSEIPFDIEDTGVIIAINPIHWDDILHSLQAAKIRQYLCPFFLEIVEERQNFE